MRTAAYFFGAERYDLRKAAARGKMNSVDWRLRSSVGRRSVRNLRQVFDELRALARRTVTSAYAAVTKASDLETIDAIMERLHNELTVVHIVDFFTEELKRTYRQAGIDALAEVEFDSTPAALAHLDEAALRFASERGAALVTQINETTRSDLRDLIASALEDGASTDELGDSISSMFAFSDARSDMIARTELAFSHVQGNLAGYRESGVEKKQWLVAQDNVCDACADLDGEVVGVDDDFDSDEFGKVSGPPLHPNCRCDIVPVTEED